MRTGLKRGLVLGMTLCLAGSSLAGCGKKKELDATAAIATLDGEAVDAGLVNFLLRYQQVGAENAYKMWLGSANEMDLSDVNVWALDLYGIGTTLGDNLKQQITTTVERMLLAEKHSADYGVELSDEEKAAITEAAQNFIAANEEETLKVMSATQETVERALTLYTIQSKVEEQIKAGVDTEVSDEEAAQRTISYVAFAPQPQEDETVEAETEEDTELLIEVETELDTEEISEAALTEVDATKTESADAEAKTEVESAAEAETAAESKEETEALTEAETEPETEDPEVVVAKEEAKARAEAFLEIAKDAEDFDAAAAEVAENDSNATQSTSTFGADAVNVDSAVISATEGLDDNTLVEQVVEVGDVYWVVYVKDAFDEDATEEKKASIVDQRKQDAVSEAYSEWAENAEFSMDEELYGKLLFDVAFTQETEVSTEEVTEALSEEETETVSEAVTEAETEARTDVATEAATEVAETE